MLSALTPHFLRDFFRLAIVNILSNLMVPLAGLIDVAFLGHLSEIRHLAGVALATVLFNYLYWTFGFLRMGTTGTTAQAVGRQDAEEVLLIGFRNLVIALAIGIAVLLLQLPVRAVGFALLSATPEVKASAEAFYNALIWGAPATLMNFVLMGWFLGRSQSSYVLLLSVVSNGVNVLLDYLLIVRWGWSSAGAGTATAISQYAMLLVGLLLVSREVSWQQVRSAWPQLYNPAALSAIFNLNREILIRTFALVTTFSLFTNLSSALGAEILAANTVLLQIVSFAAYFIDGLAFATESFAGLFQGQGKPEGLAQLVWLSGTASLGLGLLTAALFIGFPDPLFRLLTNHQSILDRIHQYVFWILPVMGFGSIAYMLDGYFLGLTQGRILRVSTLIAALVGFAPVAVLAWWLHSSHLLWLALALFMLARATTLGRQVPQTLRG